MRLSQAQMVAEGLTKAFAPACDRIQVVGSVRRGKDTVKDVELLCVPKIRSVREGQGGFFSEQPLVHYSALHQRICDVSESFSRILPITPGAPDPDFAAGAGWTIDRRWADKGRWADDARAPGYYRLWIKRHGIKVDVFLVTAPEWGWAKIHRTGSKDFAKAVVDRWRALEGRIQSNRLHRVAGAGDEAVAYYRESGGAETPLAAPEVTPSERSLFDLLGMAWLEAPERIGAESLVDAVAAFDAEEVAS